MFRNTLVVAVLTMLSLIASPAYAQTASGEAEASSDTDTCSAPVLDSETTPEEAAQIAESNARLETVSQEFLSKYSKDELVQACPAQADLWERGFALMERASTASTWSETDHWLAATELQSLATGFAASLQSAEATATTTRTTTTTTTAGESCAFKCKRERDQCLIDDGCAGQGFPCFCCVPCNATWLACLADCCLPG